jgi:endoglucanase
MHSVIDGFIASWDRKWHHVRIPLSSFTEQGSWDIDTWYTPQGKFDWTKVDNFEISTEYPELIGNKVWFDNIHISNMDTAIVRENEALGIENHSEYGKLELKVVPNPMHEFTEISVVIQTESTVNVSIYAISGIKIRSFTSQNGNPGKNVFTWDGRTDSGNEAGPGLYLCKISTSAIESTVRIIKF